MTGPLTVALASRSIPPVPPLRLIEIGGTAGLGEADFAAIASLPGAFFLWRGKEPIPIAGSLALSEKVETGKYPDPVFVSIAHRPLVESLFRTRIVPLPSGGAAGLPPKPTGRDLAGKPYELFVFQEDAARRLVEEERMLLLLPGGSGKTLPAFAAAEHLLARGEVDRVVIVSPRRGMRLTWEAFAAEYYGRSVVVIDGPPARRRSLWKLAAEAPYVVMKYETLKAPDLPRALFGPRTLVVVDEVHHVKNERTDRFRALRKAFDEGPAGAARYRIFLTGSLVYDRPVDVYGPISLLGLRVWANHDEFLARYFTVETIATNRRDAFGAPVFVEGPGDLKGPKETEELRSIIDAVSYRKSEEEIGFELPPLRREERIVDATRAEEEAYERIIDDPLAEILLEADLAPADKRVLAILTMERLFSSDPALVEGSDSPSGAIARIAVGPGVLGSLSPGSKARALVGFLGDLLGEDGGSKVVVFTPFESFLALFRRWAEAPSAFGFEPDEVETIGTIAPSVAYFSGKLSDREGDRVIASFLEDPKIRVLLSSDSGSEQINLQSASSRIVHYDDPISLGNFDQRLWRVWRRGATRPVVETRFALSPSEAFLARMEESQSGRPFVDARLRSLLEWKRNQRAALLGAPEVL